MITRLFFSAIVLASASAVFGQDSFPYRALCDGDDNDCHCLAGGMLENLVVGTPYNDVDVVICVRDNRGEEGQVPRVDSNNDAICNEGLIVDYPTGAASCEKDTRGSDGMMPRPTNTTNSYECDEGLEMVQRATLMCEEQGTEGHPARSEAGNECNEGLVVFSNGMCGEPQVTEEDECGDVAGGPACASGCADSMVEDQGNCYYDLSGRFGYPAKNGTCEEGLTVSNSVCRIDQDHAAAHAGKEGHSPMVVNGQESCDDGLWPSMVYRFAQSLSTCMPDVRGQDGQYARVDDDGEPHCDDDMTVYTNVRAASSTRQYEKYIVGSNDKTGNRQATSAVVTSTSGTSFSSCYRLEADGTRIAVTCQGTSTGTVTTTTMHQHFICVDDSEYGNEDHPPMINHDGMRVCNSNDLIIVSNVCVMPEQTEVPTADPNEVVPGTLGAPPMNIGNAFTCKEGLAAIWVEKQYLCQPSVARMEPAECPKICDMYDPCLASRTADRTGKKNICTDVPAEVSSQVTIVRQAGQINPYTQSGSVSQQVVYTDVRVVAPTPAPVYVQPEPVITVEVITVIVQTVMPTPRPTIIHSVVVRPIVIDRIATYVSKVPVTETQCSGYTCSCEADGWLDVVGHSTCSPCQIPCAVVSDNDPCKAGYDGSENTCVNDYGELLDEFDVSAHMQIVTALIDGAVKNATDATIARAIAAGMEERKQIEDMSNRQATSTTSTVTCRDQSGNTIACPNTSAVTSSNRRCVDQNNNVISCPTTSSSVGTRRCVNENGVAVACPVTTSTPVSSTGSTRCVDVDGNTIACPTSIGTTTGGTTRRCIDQNGNTIACPSSVGVSTGSVRCVDQNGNTIVCPSTTGTTTTTGTTVTSISYSPISDSKKCGSYTCECDHEGFVLGEAGASCRVCEDPCEIGDPCNTDRESRNRCESKSQKAKVLVAAPAYVTNRQSSDNSCGSYECICYDFGWIAAPDRSSCRACPNPCEMDDPCRTNEMKGNVCSLELDPSIPVTPIGSSQQATTSSTQYFTLGSNGERIPYYGASNRQHDSVCPSYTCSCGSNYVVSQKGDKCTPCPDACEGRDPCNSVEDNRNTCIPTHTERAGGWANVGLGSTYSVDVSTVFYHPYRRQAGAHGYDLSQCGGYTCSCGGNGWLTPAGAQSCESCPNECDLYDPCGIADDHNNKCIPTYLFGNSNYYGVAGRYLPEDADANGDGRIPGVYPSAGGVTTLPSQASTIVSASPQYTYGDAYVVVSTPQTSTSSNRRCVDVNGNTIACPASTSTASTSNRVCVDQNGNQVTCPSGVGATTTVTRCVDSAGNEIPCNSSTTTATASTPASSTKCYQNDVEITCPTTTNRQNNGSYICTDSAGNTITCPDTVMSQGRTCVDINNNPITCPTSTSTAGVTRCVDQNGNTITCPTNTSTNTSTRRCVDQNGNAIACPSTTTTSGTTATRCMDQNGNTIACPANVSSVISSGTTRCVDQNGNTIACPTNVSSGTSTRRCVDQNGNTIACPTSVSSGTVSSGTTTRCVDQNGTTIACPTSVSSGSSGTTTTRCVDQNGNTIACPTGTTTTTELPQNTQDLYASNYVGYTNYNNQKKTCGGWVCECAGENAVVSDDERRCEICPDPCSWNNLDPCGTRESHGNRCIVDKDAPFVGLDVPARYKVCSGYVCECGTGFLPLTGSLACEACQNPCESGNPCFNDDADLSAGHPENKCSWHSWDNPSYNQMQHTYLQYEVAAGTYTQEQYVPPTPRVYVENTVYQETEQVVYVESSGQATTTTRCIDSNGNTIACPTSTSTTSSGTTTTRCVDSSGNTIACPSSTTSSGTTTTRCVDQNGNTIACPSSTTSSGTTTTRCIDQNGNTIACPTTNRQFVERHSGATSWDSRCGSYSCSCAGFADGWVENEDFTTCLQCENVCDVVDLCLSYGNPGNECIPNYVDVSGSDVYALGAGSFPYSIGTDRCYASTTCTCDAEGFYLASRDGITVCEQCLDPCESDPCGAVVGGVATGNSCKKRGYQPAGTSTSMANGYGENNCGTYECTCAGDSGYVADDHNQSCQIDATGTGVVGQEPRCTIDPCAQNDPCNVGAHDYLDANYCHNTCTWIPEVACEYYTCTCCTGFSFFQASVQDLPVCQEDLVVVPVGDRERERVSDDTVNGDNAERTRPRGGD